MKNRSPLTLEQLRRFIFAGLADFTVTNTKTGNVEEYKVVGHKDGKGWFVKARSFDDEVEHEVWDYMGVVWADKRDMVYITKTSKMLNTDRSVQVFVWILSVLHSGKQFPDSIVFYHNGTCARCGRRLKDDKSIERGFGSHCWKMVKGD